MGKLGGDSSQKLIPPNGFWRIRPWVERWGAFLILARPKRERTERNYPSDDWKRYPRESERKGGEGGVREKDYRVSPLGPEVPFLSPLLSVPELTWVFFCRSTKKKGGMVLDPVAGGRGEEIGPDRPKWGDLPMGGNISTLV